MQLLASALFLTTLLQCSTAQNETSITPADCDTIEADAGVALDLVNRHRRDGYVFGLFRVVDAYEQHIEHSSVLYLTLDVLETECSVLSGKHWETCEYSDASSLVFGQCKIITYTSQQLKKTPKLYGFNCTVSPVPPDLFECEDCAVKYEILEVTEQHKDIAAKALEKYNSEGDHTNYFNVDKVEKILKVTGSKAGHILGFSIKETNCSRSAQHTDRQLECDFLDDWHAEVGFCKATISIPEEANGTDITCELYHPWWNYRQKCRYPPLGRPHRHRHPHHPGGHRHHHRHGCPPPPSFIPEDSEHHHNFSEEHQGSHEGPPPLPPHGGPHHHPHPPHHRCPPLPQEETHHPSPDDRAHTPPPQEETHHPPPPLPNDEPHTPPPPQEETHHPPPPSHHGPHCPHPPPHHHGPHHPRHPPHHGPHCPPPPPPPHHDGPHHPPHPPHHGPHCPPPHHHGPHHPPPPPPHGPHSLPPPPPHHHGSHPPPPPPPPHGPHCPPPPHHHGPHYPPPPPGHPHHHYHRHHCNETSSSGKHFPFQAIRAVFRIPIVNQHSSLPRPMANFLPQSGHHFSGTGEGTPFTSSSLEKTLGTLDSSYRPSQSKSCPGKPRLDLPQILPLFPHKSMAETSPK